MRADNNWEDKLGKRLRELEEEPSPVAWDRIKNDIPQKRHRWWLWLPAAILVLLTGLPLAYYYHQNTTPQLQQASQPAATGQASVAANNSTSGSVPENPAATAVASAEAGAPANTAAPVTSPTGRPASGTEADNSPVTPGKPGRSLVAVVPPPAEERPTGAVAVTTLPGSPESRSKQRASSKTASAKALQPGLLTKQTPSGALKENAGSLTIRGKTEAESATKTASSQATTRNQLSEAGTSGISAVNGSASEKNNAGNKNTGITTGSTEQAQTNAAGTGTEMPGTVTDSAAAKPVAASLAASDSAAAAKEDKIEEKTGSWAFAVYVMPQQAYQRVAANQSDDIMLVGLSQNNNKTQRLGYEIGIQSSFRATAKLSVETGLHFSMVKQKLTFVTTTSQTADSIVLQQGGNGQLSMQLLNREQTHTYYAHYYFGGLYAGGAYSFTDRLQFTAGAGANLLLKTENHSSYNASSGSGIKPYLSSGLRYTLPVGKSAGIQAGPTVQYYLTPLQSHDNLFSTIPVTIGFSVGLQFLKN